MRNSILLTIILVGIGANVYAQQGFSVDAYRQFLQSHENISALELQQDYPAGTFLNKVNIDFDNVAYLDSVTNKYQLTDDELLLLRKNGFVVTERLSHTNFALGFEDPWHKDLPVFVTTDAILHAVHMSYDNILKTCEKEMFEPMLKQSLLDMYNYLTTLDTQYGSNPAMNQSLLDADVYITVANRLIGNSTAPYFPANTAFVEELLQYCNDYPVLPIALFSGTARGIDFSQFQPRGHYVPSLQSMIDLRAYFKTMMWLGRIELVIGEMDPMDLNYQPVEDIRRQAILSCLLQEAIENTDAKVRLDKIDSALSFIVGESDNVTLGNLAELRTLAGVSTADELLDPVTFTQFQDALKTAPYATQHINTQLLLSNPFDTYQVKPASAFLVMGQRFVIDSYVLGNVVYDRVMHNNSKVRRMLPDPLDAMFALGNNAAGQLLADELDNYHYGQNLAGLRYLIDSYGDEFWDNSLYNYWLNGIRALNPKQERSTYPQSMQTAAWWQEKLNTQLASWAQLRHDNILYAKQSYSSVVWCSYPEAYLEPYPELYTRLGRYAREAVAVFTPLVADGAPAQIIPYYEKFSRTMDSLTLIAQLELAGQPLSTSQVAFLRSVMYTGSGCGGPEYSGWYPDLFFFVPGQSGFKEVDTDDATIADVHTSPTDENGAMVGWVLHAGTGKVNTCIMIAPSQNGGFTAYTGPVLSYYEHTTTNFDRLTDGEWETMVMPQTQPRPDWTNIYLADKTGLLKTAGRELKQSASSSVAVSIRFLTDTLRIRSGFTKTVSLDARNAFGDRIQSNAVWSSTGGTITSAGVFSAPAETGIYEIHADLNAEGLSAVLPVKVYPRLDTIIMTPPVVKEEVGYPFVLSIQGMGEGGAVDLHLKYMLTNVERRSVETFAAITPEIPTRITVVDTLCDRSATVGINALYHPDYFRLLPEEVTQRGNKEVKFTAWAFNAADKGVDANDVWSASLGSVTQDGIFTPPSLPGTYYVSCTNVHQTASGSAMVTVLPAIARVDLGPDTVYMNPLDTYTFEPKGYDNYGQEIELFPRWIAGNPLHREDFTMPYCSEPVLIAVGDSYDYTVKDSIWLVPTTPFKEIYITGSMRMRTNSTVQLAAFGRDCNGNTAPTEADFDPTFGSIDGSGVYTPEGRTGTCTIEATERHSNLEARHILIVMPALATLTVSPGQAAIEPDGKVYLTARATDVDGADAALAGTWYCDDGTVTITGTYTAPSTPGTYHVWFTDTLAHIADTATITVEQTTGVGGILSPNGITLSQNYPNPFNPTTSIEFSVPSRMYVSLKVFSSLGNQVATLATGMMKSGTHSVAFDARHLPSGVYFYQLEADGVRLTKSMVVMK